MWMVLYSSYYLIIDISIFLHIFGVVLYIDFLRYDDYWEANIFIAFHGIAKIQKNVTSHGARLWSLNSAAHQ